MFWGGFAHPFNPVFQTARNTARVGVVVAPARWNRGGWVAALVQILTTPLSS
jgi:hypothetical protein